MRRKTAKQYLIEIYESGATRTVEIREGLRAANKTAKEASVRAGHACVVDDNHQTVAVWHLGRREQ